MKKIALFIAAISLVGCASITDMMDGAAGKGKFTEDQNTFDGTTIISLTPDTLYDPEASIFDPVNTTMGALWTSEAPDYVNLAFSEDGGYVGFSEISFNINSETKTYKIGTSQLNFDRTSLGDMNSIAYALVPIADFKDILSAEACRMKIEKSTGYELADCTLDRVPGGKKTAILGFRKMLTAIEENTVNK